MRRYLRQWYRLRWSPRYPSRERQLHLSVHRCLPLLKPHRRDRPRWWPLPPPLQWPSLPPLPPRRDRPRGRQGHRPQSSRRDRPRDRCGRLCSALRRDRPRGRLCSRRRPPLTSPTLSVPTTGGTPRTSCRCTCLATTTKRNLTSFDGATGSRQPLAVPTSKPRPRGPPCRGRCRSIFGILGMGGDPTHSPCP